MLPPTRLCSFANITKLYIKGHIQLGAYFSFVSLACGQPSSDSYDFPQCVEFHQLRWFCGISCYPTGTLLRLSCHRNAAELNLPFQGERAVLQSPTHIFSLAICICLTESKPNLHQKRKHGRLHAVYQRKGRQSHHVLVFSRFTYDMLVSPPIICSAA